MNRKDVIARLVELQNHKMFWNVDILTITGFMESTSEVLEHWLRCKKQIENAA